MTRLTVGLAMTDIGTGTYDRPRSPLNDGLPIDRVTFVLDTAFRPLPAQVALWGGDVGAAVLATCRKLKARLAPGWKPRISCARHLDSLRLRRFGAHFAEVGVDRDR